MVHIPDDKMECMVGFSVEAIVGALGGTLDPLLDAIKSGAIKGIGAVVGCNNPKVQHDYGHVRLLEELIKQDVLVVTTGCNAIAAAKAGLLLPEAAEQAGDGLKGVCQALGVPPVLHMGSCVDISRILVACAAIANALGVDISDLPAAGAAPEWMSEKAVSIGAYVVSSGVFTVLGTVPQVLGSPAVTGLADPGRERRGRRGLCCRAGPVQGCETDGRSHRRQAPGAWHLGSDDNERDLCHHRSLCGLPHLRDRLCSRAFAEQEPVRRDRREACSQATAICRMGSPGAQAADPLPSL